MMKSIFIVNPNSGSRLGEIVGRKLQQTLSKLDYPYEIIYTTKPKHATTIAAKYQKNDNVQIIAVGGDGTMNEVLNGIRAGVSMGIIPCGSGNDFYRMIDPHIENFDLLVKNTILGNKVLVDYGVLNGTKFLGSFSIGLDAQVVYNIARLQLKNVNFRKSTYVRALFKTLKEIRPILINFEDESIQVNKKILLISALNGKYYGGGFKAAPNSDILDGRFDICIIDEMKSAKLIPLIPLYMRGKHYNHKSVLTLQTNHFTLSCSDEVIAQCDGELLKSKDYELHVVNKGISLLIPKKE